MDADASLATVPSYGRASLSPADRDSSSFYGRPVPSVRRQGATPNSVGSRQTRARDPEVTNLAASFPLFFFGAGCVAAAAFVLLEGTGAAIGRIPLWVPFIALGIIALAGGTLSVFAEPDETAEKEVPKEISSPPRIARPRTSRPPEGPRPKFRPAQFASQSPPPSQTDPNTGPVPVRTRPAGPVSSDTSAAAKAPTNNPEEAATSLPLPDDADALLKEIDLIAADIHASHLPGRATSPRVQAPAPAPAPTAKVSLTAPVTVQPRPATAPVRARADETPEWLESEAPRKVAHCVGCGSVILHAKAPSQCQVCGEPLCTDCRDRSLREGKPNLCPLCALLDTVHSKGPPTAQGSRRP
jgi:hypothetical protein